MDFNLYTISKKNFISRTYLVKQDEELIYKARISFFKRKFVILDYYGHEVFRIKRYIRFTGPRFEIFYENEPYARVESKGILAIKLLIETPDHTYQVEGHSFRGGFTIYQEGEEVAKLSRHTFSTKNRMGLAIKSGHDDELIIALAFLVEMAIQARKSKG